MPDVGESAPSFSLLNQNGERIELKDFKGRNLVIYFYPRADTPGCTTEACGFRDDWAEFEEENIGVVGISCLLYTSPSPRDPKTSRMPSSA